MKRVIVFIAFIAFVVAAYLLGVQQGKRAVLRGLKPQVDTLYHTDTLTFEKPVPVAYRVRDSIPYPVYLPKYIHDTVTIYLPREEKVYEDSTYRAVVSGYEPRLDTISVFPQQSLIVKTIPIEVTKPSRWGIGIQAGYGIGNAGLSPYIGVGVSYNLVYW